MFNLFINNNLAKSATKIDIAEYLIIAHNFHPAIISALFEIADDLGTASIKIGSSSLVINSI